MKPGISECSNTVKDEEGFCSSGEEFEKPLIKDQSLPIPSVDIQTEEEDEEDESCCCSICFESWSSSGSHRLVSLRCGHLFGKSCIEKWIRNRERTTSKSSSTCPQCNFPAKINDIRPLFCPKKLSAVQQCEQCLILQASASENLQQLSKAKEQQSKLQLAYQSALAEVSHLQRLLERERQRNRILSLASSTSMMNNHSPWSLKANWALCSAAGGTTSTMTSNNPSFQSASCLDWDVGKQLLLIGMHSRVKDAFGVCKVNLGGPPFDFYPLHASTIKQMACSSRGNDRVLTASMDKTLVLSSFVGKACIWSKTFHTAVWSCAFHRQDENLLYAGLADGTVVEMDLRRSQSAVRTWNPLENLPCTARSRTPVHSLGVSTRGKWLVGGNYGGIFRLSLESSSEIGFNSGNCEMNLNIENYSQAANIPNDNSQIHNSNACSQTTNIHVHCSAVGECVEIAAGEAVTQNLSMLFSPSSDDVLMLANSRCLNPLGMQYSLWKCTDRIYQLENNSFPHPQTMLSNLPFSSNHQHQQQHQSACTRTIHNGRGSLFTTYNNGALNDDLSSLSPTLDQQEPHHSIYCIFNEKDHFEIGEIEVTGGGGGGGEEVGCVQKVMINNEKTLLNDLEHQNAKRLALEGAGSRTRVSGTMMGSEQQQPVLEYRYLPQVSAGQECIVGLTGRSLSVWRR